MRTPHLMRVPHWTRKLLGLAFVAFLLWLTPQPIAAETIEQMRMRVVGELKSQHADVLAGCDQACIDNYITGPLRKLAERTNPYPRSLVSEWVNDVVLADISLNYEWGIRFEMTKAANTDCRMRSTPANNVCAPTDYDWAWAASDNLEDLRKRLDATPEIYRVQNHEAKRFELKWEYGGAY